MTKETWDAVEDILCDIGTCLDDIEGYTDEDDFDVLHEVNNIRQMADRLYGLCEADYCDDSTDDLPHGYEEVWPMLPDGNSLSAGDMDRLKEHIQAWKEGR